MATTLDLVSFLVLLSSVCCREPQPAQENVSPIINMQLNSRKKMLSWNYIRNVSEQECVIYTPLGSPTSQPPQVTEDDTHYCIFRNHVLHRGANLTVNVTCDGNVFQELLVFANPGVEGSGAMNFSCFIYNVRFMNCSWAPGSRAPADVCYQLFWWASLHEDEVECPHYIMNSEGMRVGCHFDQLGEPQNMDNYFFLVNGTSRTAAIPFLDFVPFQAYKIEKYDPPTNITITYNRSHHIIKWDNPEIRYDLSSYVLYYELDIQRAGGSSKTKHVFQRGQDRNVYLMPSSAARVESTFRARVRYVYNDLWSEWSPTVLFGLPEEREPRGARFDVVVWATAVPALLLMCLCKRFYRSHKLFPPIPQVKKEITGALMPTLEVAWDDGHPPPGSQEPEDVLMVEETW